MLTRIFAVMAVAGLPMVAMADPSITKDQIKKHFAKGITCESGCARNGSAPGLPSGPSPLKRATHANFQRFQKSDFGLFG